MFDYFIVIMDGFVSPEGESAMIQMLDNWQDTIIDLHFIKSVLNYRDVRSALNWCRTHEVYVLSQGNAQVVNLIEFILAFYKPYLEHLKRTKKENWKTVFLNYVSANVSGILAEKRELQQRKNQYKPKTNVETAFLKKMKDL
jgi:hypothetical protein